MKLEKGAMSQGSQDPLEGGRSKVTHPPIELQEGMKT